VRLCRVHHEGDVRFGICEAGDEQITLISDEPFAAWEPVTQIPFEGAHFLAPVMPTKVVCVGVNYKAHAAEMGHDLPVEPLIFMKPPTAVIGTGGEIRWPAMAGRVDHEAELAIVLGRRAHQVEPADVPELVLGFTCANDVTARDVQRRDGQWTRAKGFDTFCPLGPWIETELDPSDLAIECRVDGEIRQSARTSDMIFDPATLVSFISKVMTLLPGDVVLTGTPSGIGPLDRGDLVEVTIEGIGTLTNRLV
jgi:2-keto-4-pentenoate hydratase/2-oxohepta-3-ene-1,7-dioic acid hydratase in catechol pathway